MTSVAAQLRQQPTFAGLSESAARTLAVGTQRVEYAPGQVVVIEGQPARHVYYLTSGLVRVFFPRRKDRAALTLALRAAPGMFGDIAVLNGTPYTSSVDALGPVVVLAVDERAWRATLAAEPQVALAHYRSLAERFLGATQNQRSGIEPRPVERVAALLLSYAQHAGVVVDNGILIDAAIAQEDIAEQTASTRRTVVRALADLFASGTLLRRGRKFVVADVDALARVALGR
jgi:CRP/FNR family transcriptional regulator